MGSNPFGTRFLKRSSPKPVIAFSFFVLGGAASQISYRSGIIHFTLNHRFIIYKGRDSSQPTYPLMRIALQHHTTFPITTIPRPTFRIHSFTTYPHCYVLNNHLYRINTIIKNFYQSPGRHQLLNCWIYVLYVSIPCVEHGYGFILLYYCSTVRGQALRILMSGAPGYPIA